MKSILVCWNILINLNRHKCINNYDHHYIFNNFANIFCPETFPLWLSDFSAMQTILLDLRFTNNLILYQMSTVKLMYDLQHLTFCFTHCFVSIGFCEAFFYRLNFRNYLCIMLLDILWQHIKPSNNAIGLYKEYFFVLSNSFDLFLIINIVYQTLFIHLQISLQKLNQYLPSGGYA